MMRDIVAICDAYESGIGHGLRRDGHSSGAFLADPEHGKAYEAGYQEGERRITAAPSPGTPTVDLDAQRLLFEAANKHRPLMREDFQHPDPEVHHRYYDTETQAAWEGWESCAISRAKAAVADTEAAAVAELATALADPGQTPYLIVYDDYDRAPEHVRGLMRALLRYKQISASWNAHLFVKIDSNSRDCLTPNDGDLRLQAGLDEQIASFSFAAMPGTNFPSTVHATPADELASLRTECARLSRGWSETADRLTRLSAGASVDAARIAHLEQWRNDSKQRGCQWNAYSFHMGTSVGAQIDAQLSAKNAADNVRRGG